MRVQALLVAALALAFVTPVEARTRNEIKCERYAQAWDFTLKRRSQAGLSADFLARHAAFLRSGCEGEHDVCPRSSQEFDLANTMVILSMNAGMASTFAPFGCPK